MVVSQCYKLKKIESEFSPNMSAPQSDIGTHPNPCNNADNDTEERILNILNKIHARLINIEQQLERK